MTTFINYPIPPTDTSKHIEMDIYARFMRHIRLVPHNREEIKVLIAIQFVSDMTASSEAHVSKVLVELGLTGPRSAFPAEYLDYVDASMMREGFEYGAPSMHTKDLVDFWSANGEDKFAAYKRQYSLLNEEIYSGVHY